MKGKIMNGFDPLGGLKGWHIIASLALACVGIIAALVWIIKGIVWLFNHITIS